MITKKMKGLISLLIILTMLLPLHLQLSALSQTEKLVTVIPNTAAKTVRIQGDLSSLGTQDVSLVIMDPSFNMSAADIWKNKDKIAGLEQVTLDQEGKIDVTVPLTSVVTEQDYMLFINGESVIDTFRFRLGSDVSAPAEVTAREDFNITVVTGTDVSRLIIKNEKGMLMGQTLVSKDLNEHGKQVWTIAMGIGTPGANRTFHVFDQNENLIGSFTVNVLVGAVPTGIVSVSAPPTSDNRSSFQVTVTTGVSVTRVEFTNEAGGKLGKTLVSYTREGDDIKTWVFELVIGTAGSRTINVIGSTTSATTYTESFPITITRYVPTAADVTINSVTVPATAVVYADFQVILVCSKDTSKVAFYNEKGSGLGRTLVSRTPNADGTVTFVYSMVIATPGVGRVISMKPAADGTEYFDSDKTFTIDIVVPTSF